MLLLAMLLLDKPANEAVREHRMVLHLLHDDLEPVHGYQHRCHQFAKVYYLPQKYFSSGVEMFYQYHLPWQDKI